MQVTIVFDTDNDAFYGAGLAGEVRAVLRQAERFILDSGEAKRTLRDSNGNSIGRVAVEGD